MFSKKKKNYLNSFLIFLKENNIFLIKKKMKLNLKFQSEDFFFKAHLFENKIQ